MTGLAYTPRTVETEQTDRLLSQALPPKENVLFPKDLKTLIIRWKTISKNHGFNEADLSKMTGLDGNTIRTAMTTGKVTVADAMCITDALGYSLKRIPYGLKRNQSR